MNLPAFPKTKKSGTSWLGDVPEHWDVRRMKFAAPLINNKIDAQESDLPYMGLEHVESWTGRRIPDETAASDGVATHFMSGDVLFGKLRPYLAKVYLADCEGVASTELLVLRSEEDVCPEFLRYYTVSREFINAVDSSTYGAKMPRANWELIGNLPFLIPSPDEQRSIAKFLDQKTGQIDELIGKKKELIQKLTEQRSALITAAVTGKIPEIGRRRTEDGGRKTEVRGQKSAVRMKDSGVEWIGAVPEHWEVRRIKTIGTIRYGLGEPPAYQDEGLLFIRATDIFRGKIVLENMKRISSADVPWSRNPSVKAGEIIVVRSGAYTGDSAIVTKGLDGAIAGFDMVLTIDDGCPEFVAYALLSKYLLQGQIYLARMRAAQPHLNAEELGGFHFIAPPAEEQQVIAEYLDEKTGKIDGLIRTTETAIQTLEEYRTALITAAVTGKVDVRQADSGSY